MSRTVSGLSVLSLGALALALEGCKGCAEEAGPSAQLVALDATPTGLWVGEGVGVGTVEVPVLATNAMGAAVGGVDVTLASDATITPTVATIGAGGWTTAAVTADRGAWTVTATLADGTSATGTAWSVGAGPGAFEYPAWDANGTATTTAAAGSGVAWSVGPDIWWSAQGAPPVRVASLSSAVLAMMAVAVDADGETDLLAWSADEVVLLRGRDGGGLSWGAGFSGGAGGVVGATLVNRGGDAYPDLAVAFDVEGDVGRVELYDGDGVWGFTFRDALDLPFAAYGLSTEDVDQDGEHEVTVLTVDGLLRRFALFDGAWTSTSLSAEYDLGIGPGAVLWPATDVNGDGLEDVVASGPLLSGEGWQAAVATVGADEPLVYKMFSETGDYAWPDGIGLGLGDLTGDGTVDLALSTPDGRLHRVAWYVADGDTEAGFHIQTFTVMPHGAAAVGEVTGDDVADVVLAGSAVAVIPGERVADDPATEDVDETVTWRPENPTTTFLNLRAALRPHVEDIDGDGLADVVALRWGESEGAWTDELTITGWRGAATDGTGWLREGGAVVLAAAGGEPLGLAVCGTRAYALVASGGVTKLHRFDLDADLGPVADGAALTMDAAQVVCGAFGDFEVVGLAADGTSNWVKPDGSVEQGTVYDAAVDAAAADPDGDGIDEIVTCAAEGCEVAVGDLDGDGMDDVVSSGAGTIEVTLAGEVHALASDGVPGVSDVDDDGVFELVVGDGGKVIVYAGTTGGLAPGQGRYVWRPAYGPGVFGDLTGDGVPDAFLFGADLTEVESPVWEGSIVLARASLE